jgi:hypothetical protein
MTVVIKETYVNFDIYKILERMRDKWERMAPTVDDLQCTCGISSAGPSSVSGPYRRPSRRCHPGIKAAWIRQSTLLRLSR